MSSSPDPPWWSNADATVPPVLLSCPNAGCGYRRTLPPGQGAPPARCPACRSPFGEAPGPDLPAPSGPPRRIGRFEVRAELGAGAFGAVYRAYDPDLEREVALKVPHPGTLNSPRRVQRFLGDARAAARLRHPHIVPVFDA